MHKLMKRQKYAFYFVTSESRTEEPQGSSEKRRKIPTNNAREASRGYVSNLKSKHAYEILLCISLESKNKF